MFEFFETLFINLDRHDNHVIIVAVYLSLAAFVIILRIFSHLHFRGAIYAFVQEARKEIRNRDELKNIKNKLLRKITADYIRVADRAVTTVPTSKIVQRNLSKMSFLGWRYEGLVPFIEGMETAFLWIGVILAFAFSQHVFVYGLLAIIVFLLTRFFAAFFNISNAKSELEDELVIFMEREVGRFFASDSGGAVLRLKNDLTEAINKQAEAYKSTMETISKTMSESMKEVSSTMIAAAKSIGPIVANAMDEKLVDMNTQLKDTLNDWETALKESARIQTDINTSADRLSYAGGQLQAASELLATHMKGHSNALSNQLNTLVTAIDSVKDCTESLMKQQEVLQTKIEYINENQETLGLSLDSYKASLQNLTSSLGDGLGAYINLHAQNSAQAINDVVKANTDKIVHLINSKGV